MEKFEIKAKNTDFDLFEFIKRNNVLIYSVLFYSAGLLCGSFVYKRLESDVLNSLFSVVKLTFGQELINNLSFYFLIFAVSVLMGICLIGFPFMNLIPFFFGVYIGMEISYYYITYGIKGFGFALLMVAPFACLFLTVLIQTISKSYVLSKRIYNITIKKSDTADNVDYKLYLKNFVMYGLIIILIAFINTGLSQALGTIISLD